MLSGRAIADTQLLASMHRCRISDVQARLSGVAVPKLDKRRSASVGRHAQEAAPRACAFMLTHGCCRSAHCMEQWLACLYGHHGQANIVMVSMLS